jgi:membrane-associated phospholipid phosphatase
MNKLPISLEPPALRARRRVRVLGGVLALAAGLLILSLLDMALWRAMRVENLPALERKDWYQVLRQCGSLLPWLIVAGALWLHDRGPRRALLLAGGATLGGAAAEVVKLITQRLRPGDSGEYVFRWMVDGLPNGHLVKGVGLASSHAGVAFGAAFMLAYLFPRVGPLAVGLAIACSVTRLLAGAHFATDVYVAAALSYAVVLGLRRLDGNTRAAA